MRLTVLASLLLGLYGFFFPTALAAADRPESSIGSGVVTLEYYPGSATSTLRLLPVREQRFAVVAMQGTPALVQTSRAADGNAAWHFDVPDGIWRGQVGDAVLTVQFIASAGQYLNWLAYDSAFHVFHGLDQPPLAAITFNDLALSMTWQALERSGADRFSATFLLRKAFFRNRCSGADFLLNPDSAQVVGVTGLRLEIRPPDQAKRRTSIDPTGFVRSTYRRFFGRLPKPEEEQLALEAFGRQRLDLPTFFRRLMQRREFCRRHFRPFTRQLLIDRMFRLMLGRRPSPVEMDALNESFDSDRNDQGILLMTEKFSYLAAERLFSFLDAGRSR